MPQSLVEESIAHIVHQAEHDSCAIRAPQERASRPYRAGMACWPQLPRLLFLGAFSAEELAAYTANFGSSALPR
jgi:hypothetical protein